MTQLVIATPFDGPETATCCVGYGRTLARMLASNHGLEYAPEELGFSTDIVRARNRIAAMVLREAPQASHILWWDSDVFPHDIGVVKDMIATGLPVIGAPYLRKWRTGRCWTHRPHADHVEPTAEDESRGWMPVKSVGLGFTVTRTDFLREIGSACREYTDKVATSKHKVRGLFDLIYVEDEEGDTVQESEDYSFCWRAGGAALYIGPGSVTSHVGGHAWRLGGVVP